MKKITLMFALLLLSICANAQWTTDTAVNSLVSTSAGDDHQSFGTNDGRTFTAFWKSVPAPTNYELRVQLLDANGNKMFGDEGMLVTNTLPMSTYTVIWKATLDKYNNFYIGATGTGTGTEAHIYKITPTGEMPWGAGGISLGAGYLPTPIVLNNMDLIISYWPGSGKAKMQRYTPAGVPVWAAPVDVNPSTTYSTRGTVVADMYQMTNGDFTAVFHIKNTNGVGSLLFAQKYNDQGIAQWTEPTQLCDKGTVYNTFYTGAQDSDVVYYGYSAATGLRYDGFVQRLNADGTTPWGINGMDFDTNLTNYEMDTKIAFQQGSQYVWAISRYTTSAQSLQGEYVQKFDKASGARQFTDTAHQVYAINDTYQCHSGNLFLVGDKPLFLTTTGFNNGATPLVLGATFLDANGNLAQPAMTPVGTYAASKGRVVLCRPYNNQAVAVFAETKASSIKKIYAQNFSTAVSCEIAPATLTDVNAQCSVAYADLTVPNTVDTCGNAIVPTTDQTVFPITTAGTTAITWTYTSLAGAVVTRTQNIVIADTTAPVPTVAALPAITAQCQASVDAVTAPTATDACAGTITATTDAVFPISAFGTTTITWTYNDGHGNTSTQTQAINIVDTVAPVATVTTLPNLTAQCEFTADMALAAAPTATDGCSGSTIITATTNATFPITTQGTSTITWTYNDGNGNTSTQTQNVVIADTTAPVLILQNSVVAIAEDGTAVVTAAQFDNGSTDACSTIATWTVTPESFDCDAVGEQTVTITATDAHGNVASGTATVTVQDPDNHCTAGVNDLEKESFLVYPNPASDMLYIRPASNTVITAVRVYSLIGQQVLNMAYNDGTAESNISVQGLAAGTYLVNIQTTKGSVTKKIVKK